MLIPNLLQRRFSVSRPNKVWATDITYIRTWQRWLYLAAVMDPFSRKIVGWSAGPSIQRELVLDAVLMAIRRPGARGTLNGTRKAYFADLADVPLLIVDDLSMRKLPHTAAEDLLDTSWAATSAQQPS